MDEMQVLKIMKIIQSTYRAYFKTESEVRDALAVMVAVLADQEYRIVEQALYEFIRTDTKGFPPVPGQLIALAEDIKAAERRERQIESVKLEEPPGIPMPDEVRNKINAMLDGMKV